MSRMTRRAVAAAKARWRAGHRRTYRPWITEPGLWLQWDWGKGPLVPGPDGEPRGTLLFCAWLARSRFRIVLPTWDRTLPTLIACLDAMLRRIGGVPVYALTDNEKTVTVEHVAGVPVRHPEIVAVGRHYGMTVHTCVPVTGNQGRVGGDGPGRQGRPGPGGGEPAGGLRELRRAGGGVRGVRRRGERAGAPGDVRGPRGAAGDRAGPAAPGAAGAAYRRAGHHPDGEHRSDDPVRLRAVFGPAGPGGRGGVGPRRSHFC